MFKKLALLGLFFSVAGCSSHNSGSGSVSWNTLDKKATNSDYCVENYKEDGKVEQCKIEYAALQHAKAECQKDSNPDYCLLMAEFGWDNFKEIVLKNPPTMWHAENYPVMCGYKEKKVTPCSKLK